MNMSWLGKVRPQVAIAIIFLGSAMLYSLRVGATEAAAGFGGLVAMLAKEIISTDD